MEGPIAVQGYYDIERSLSHQGTASIAREREICLYANKLVTHAREFPLNEVYDLSYRKMGREGGILYLHTNQGVFPHQVSLDPALFIEAYRTLNKR